MHQQKWNIGKNKNRKKKLGHWFMKIIKARTRLPLVDLSSQFWFWFWPVLLQFDDVHPVTWGKRSLFVLILNNDRHWCLVNNRSKLHCICIDILGFRFKDEDEWSRSRCHRGRLPLLVNMEENSCLVLDSGFSVGYFSLKESTDTLVVRFSGLAISLKKS